MGCTHLQNCGKRGMWRAIGGNFLETGQTEGGGPSGRRLSGLHEADGSWQQAYWWEQQGATITATKVYQLCTLWRCFTTLKAGLKGVNCEKLEYYFFDNFSTGRLQIYRLTN